MKNLLRLIGAAVALAAGVYFVLYAHKALSGHDLSALWDQDVLIAGGLLVFLYAVAIPLTGMAWTWLLRMLGQPARYSRLVPILAVTQFGKYLPGNVAQHIGRITLVKAAGIGLGAAILSITYETILSIVVCAHITALTFLWVLPAELSHWKILQYRQILLIVITFCAIIAIAATPRISRQIAHYRARKSGNQGRTPSSLNLDWGTIIACYILYLVNIVLTGCGLWLVAHALLGASHAAPSLLYVTGAFASTWIFGFLAPGAPAGLGVREAVLSAWLVGIMQPSQAIMLIVMLRIATTVGDLINLLWGSIVMSRQHASVIIAQKANN